MIEFIVGAILVLIVYIIYLVGKGIIAFFRALKYLFTGEDDKEPVKEPVHKRTPEEEREDYERKNSERDAAINSFVSNKPKTNIPGAVSAPKQKYFPSSSSKPAKPSPAKNLTIAYQKNGITHYKNGSLEKSLEPVRRSQPSYSRAMPSYAYSYDDYLFDGDDDDDYDYYDEDDYDDHDDDDYYDDDDDYDGDYSGFENYTDDEMQDYIEENSPELYTKLYDD